MRLEGMDRRTARHGALWLAGGVAVAAALCAALWPAPASSHGDDDKKLFTATVALTPAAPEDDAPADAFAEAWAGSTPSVSVTVGNAAKSPQKFGSANVAIPAGITPVPGPVTLSSTQSGFAGTATVVGGQLRLRNLGVAPGKSVTATFAAQVTCAPAAASYPLSTAVKQSNDFNGTGNDFAQSGPTPALDAVGACTLAFSTQPASAQRETDITGDVYLPFDATPPGAPVAVQVRDGSGAAPVTWWTAPVSLALASNPGSATLHGTTSATPVSGTATFKNPAAGEPGPRIGVSTSGYRLSASSPGIPAASAPSSAFDIVDVGKRCASATACTGTSTTTKTAATVTSSANIGDVLRLSLGALGTPAPVCAGYTPTTDILDFDLTTPAGAPTGGQRTIVLTLLAPFVTRPASAYDACFQSTLPFTTKSGAPATLSGGYYTGLLPECSCGSYDSRHRATAAVPPCEQSTVRTRTGDIVMTIIAPPGDPRARF